MPRKAVRRPRRRLRRRGMRKMKSETASLRETFEFAQLTTGAAYYDYTNSLARYARASLVAQGYREFRITKVEYRFKPAADTFPTGGTSIPYLYAMVDKTGSMRDFNTTEEIVSAGAKARRLDDKTIVFSYKPATLQYNRDENAPGNNQALWAKPIVSPWLSCDRLNDDPSPPAGAGFAPSSIDHLGLVWIVATSTGSPIGYTLEVVSHFEFRKPSWTIAVKDPLIPLAQQALGKKEVGAPTPETT